MTSPLPPKRRDTRSEADMIRQDRTRLNQLDRGLAGGRAPMLRPLKPSGLGDADEDDFDDALDDEIAFHNLDETTATDPGYVTFPLTYEPIDGSLHVRWRGIDQPPTDWSLSGTTVTMVDRHIKAGDIFTAAYAYYPSDVPEPVEPVPATPVTATLRGATSRSGSNSAGMTSLALPAGTVLGDMIVVSGTSNTAGNLVVSDSRLTPLGYGLWIGFASTLADIAATATGGFGTRYSIACITLNTNAAGWTAATVTSDTSMVTGDYLSVGSVSGVSAAVCAIHDRHAYVSGLCDAPTGYTTGSSSATSLSHSRVDFWTNGGVLGTSPAGTSLFSGGDGEAYSTVVGLIGP